MAITLAGCGQQTVQLAPEGAASATEIPIGPIPGSGNPPAARPNPYEGDATAGNEGYQYFQWYNCSGCHGIHGGGGMGPSLRDTVWIYGSSPDHIFDSIAEGRSKGMPAWGIKIPQEQIWKIVTYIETLSTPGEINPPSMPLADQQEHAATVNQPATPPPAASAPPPPQQR